MTKTISNWEKFKLLLWKNWLIQKFHKWQLLIEILIPVIFTFQLVLLRGIVEAEPKPSVEYSPVNISNLDIFLDKIVEEKIPKLEIHYSPTNPMLENIIKTAAEYLNINSYKGHESASKLETELIKNNIFAGVQFDDEWSNIMTYPNKFAFSLRFPSELRTSSSNFSDTWLTNNLVPLYTENGPRNKDDVDGGIPVGYVREGFLPLQNALSIAFLKLSSGTKELPEILLQRYPYPEYISDPLLQGISLTIPMLIMLSFLYAATNIAKNVTMEKEKQLKEVMKIMGLDNWLHWTAWFVKAFVFLLISIIIMTIFFKIQWSNDVAVFTYSSWSALAFFMIIYAITTICFCFMMATFFSKASTAAAVTGLVWFVTYLPYSIAIYSYADMSLFMKLMWSMIVNTGMGFGFKVILDHEGTGEGLQWSNMFSSPSVDDELSVGLVLVMMSLSCVVYMVICLYLEQVFPGEYGVAKKWNFPLKICSSHNKNGHMHTDNTHMDTAAQNPEAFEVTGTNGNVGIYVQNLQKKFDNKIAVKNLTMNMFEDEITVLLGHNGAGKTTTISMLTGMFSPTAGSAIINGFDIRENIEGARSSLGICPQHNVLFDDITVADHIEFFSRLKGLSGKAVKEEVKYYLELIQLEDKANVVSSKLSGGMKRKLSVCCALCGDTKVVLCDEPSSGMDPAARRQMWDLLQTEKIGRTILLTTHFMDEADVLGDRIAIMCGGELKCLGTSFFLKKKYGSGYHLICVKRDNCKVSDVTALLNKFIPNMVPESDIGTELSYQLPDSFSAVFEDMFAALEQNSNQLNLNGYGVSITSMEEVFMKVGAEENYDISGDHQLMNINAVAAITDKKFSQNKSNITFNQWHAMLFKKILYTYRNKILFAVQNLIPILFLVTTILFLRSQGTFSEMKPMNIGISQYPVSTTILETVGNIESNSLEAVIASAYKFIATSISDNHSFDTTGTKTFPEFIMELGQDIQVRVNSRYLAAATISKGRIIAWLNNQPLHTAPLTLNMVHNAMAHALIGPGSSISVINAPLPYTAETIFFQLNIGNNLGTQLASNICFCMCFVSAFYILFLIKEKESRSKLLQFVGGVRVFTFWLTQFLWDISTFTITVIIIIVTLAIFQEEGLATFDELGRYFLMIFVFGVSVIPFTYLLSYLFKEPATGFARTSILNIFTGMITFMFVLVLSFDFIGSKNIADALQIVFRVFPHFSLTNSLNKLYSNVAIRNACNNQIYDENVGSLCDLIPQCCTNEEYFAWKSPGVLPELLYMLITAALFFAMLIVIEYGLIGEILYKINCKNCSKKLTAPENGFLDQDVANERHRVANMSTAEVKEQNMVLDRLTKFYGKFLAVNQVSLSVNRNECFGLLGVNGAGKTTTFKMMTGDERITSGVAYVKGMNIKNERNKIYQEIGYCPQFDALLDDFTGRETLIMFCLLRGISKQHISELIEQLASSFGFTRHLDKQIKAYSGGNKRKLSTALAVLASPAVVYLDEPTSGMDPAARRQLWNMVCQIRDTGTSIVLTSHSMEECEALCTRLAIMVNGEFKCIGSTQHLKNKFSKGLVLKMKLKRAIEGNAHYSRRQVDVLSLSHFHIQVVKSFVLRHFPHAALQEDYQGILTFYIPLTTIKWSQMFGLIERNRVELNIEDYSISQTTLEEIFLEFAKYQREDTRAQK
ncbi:ATP-binding cassette sub-family A member 3-like [Teleopsis dalmanni]|uniref:ATP-binding cassette sub-family A member 3-like n=1 Tax=Teleopsis dalmanni TaxID=139649 RepID=UPI0018CC973F|nr:ATP-binding cassette sub-family A member 3-like [Teleopsis dalmanni]